MHNDHRKGVAWALASAFSIATFVIPWKVAAAHGGTRTNALILLTSAALFSTLLAIVQRGELPRWRRFDFVFAGGLAVLTLLGNIASAEAIQIISPSLLTVLQRSEVIVVAVLAWPLIGERVETRFWLGSLVAIAGLVLIQTPFDAARTDTEGIAWAMLSVLSFGTMAVITRKFVHRIDLVAVNGLRLWLSVGIWFAFYGLPDELREITREQILYASLAAFFGPFIGRLCIMTSARYIEVRVTTVMTLAAPPITLALAYALLSDLPTERQIQGGLLMLTGIAISVVRWPRSR